MALRVIVGVIGAAAVLEATWSVFGTLVVPRRVRSAIPRIIGLANRRAFAAVADRSTSYERRDRILALQAPVQLVTQVLAWLALYEAGFGLLMWSVQSGVDLGAGFEQAASSLFTLGYLVPNTGAMAVLSSLGALAGLGTVTIQIAYLPTLYAAFNRRETLITMLDSRAGVPSWGPELLARTHYGLGTGVSSVSELPELFEDWEQWSADVSESHSTYLPLVWFRSPRPLSSWLTAQLAVLDAAALYLALMPNARGQIKARLCLRGGFTCLGTVARALRFPIPEEASASAGISLTYEEFEGAVHRLRDVNFPIERPVEDAWADFAGWRVNYEAAAYAIALAIDAPPVPWSGPRRHALETISPARPKLAAKGQFGLKAKKPHAASHGDASAPAHGGDHPKGQPE